MVAAIAGLSAFVWAIAGARHPSRLGGVDGLQFPVAGLDGGLLGGQVQRAGQDQVHQAGDDQADQPGVVHAVGQVGREPPV